MTTEADSERRKKALMYTGIICGTLLLMFILISWTSSPPPPPPPPLLIEINLGNDEEGFGEEQPLVKGAPAPPREARPQPTPPPQEEGEKINTDDNAPDDAAPVPKADKKAPKLTSPTPATVITPLPKPQKPKFTMPDGTSKTGGNNANEDNDYRMQGNDKNGKGDHGSPTGDKDSYGTTPGGRTGGPRILTGNRKIVRYYSFTGDLPKATINAVIRVSPSGTGTFSSFGKGSTATGAAYSSAIAGYLRNMQFDKAADESMVTVQFNFTVQ